MVNDIIITPIIDGWSPWSSHEHQNSSFFHGKELLFNFPCVLFFLPLKITDRGPTGQVQSMAWRRVSTRSLPWERSKRNSRRRRLSSGRRRRTLSVASHGSRGDNQPMHLLLGDLIHPIWDEDPNDEHFLTRKWFCAWWFVGPGKKRVPVVQKIFASYLVRMNLKGVEAPVLPYTIWW